MIATFNVNPQTTIISCYSPTNISDETEVKKFYQELISVTKQVSKHNLSHKLRCYTEISGPGKSRNNTREKISYFFHVCWYSQSAADTSLAFGALRSGWWMNWNTQHLITRVKNRFAALQDTTLTNSAKTKYNHFELACKEIAADTIPLKPKIKKRTPWETEEICQKRKHLHEAAQVWKIDDFHQVLLDFCNNVHNQDPINRWRKGCLLPIPKKDNLAITKNYCGITLTAIPAKIYNLMLLNRIKPKINPVLRKNQNGFRTNRSTSGQIFTIRRILEGI